MITEDFTVLDQFISVPKDMQGLNCASLVGGIVEGMLDGGEFVCFLSIHFDIFIALPTLFLTFLASSREHPFHHSGLSKNAKDSHSY